VLGNLLGIDGFDYESSAGVLAELRGIANGAAYDGKFEARREFRAERRGSTTSVPLYGVDALVRRAPALQRTRTALGG
jgi:NADH-quinone oxidoreductase subunit G